MNVAYLILGFCGIGILWCAWALICNSRTSRQRGELADWVFADSEHWVERLALYNAVSYDRHMWALQTFRNPWKLYGEEIEKLMADAE
jgi:hypothetical protein